MGKRGRGSEYEGQRIAGSGREEEIQYMSHFGRSMMMGEVR